MRELEERVERIRPSATVADPYNPRGARRDWSGASFDTLVMGLIFVPEEGQRKTTLTSDSVILPPTFYGTDPTVDVVAGDRLVRYDGTVWGVEDEPERWDCNPGWPSGIVIRVRRVMEVTP